MKFKKIIAFNIALIAICANSVMSVSALSFPELNVPELEYTPLEIPEDMPSPYENFEEKKAEKMQSLLNKGYGQSYSLGALSMPSGYGQTATDVYNRIGDKSFGEGWQEWGSQIEVPEYSSLASKHATIRAEGQANMDALPSAEQRFNQSKYTLLSNDEGARYTYDKAQEARLQHATIEIEQQITSLQAAYQNELSLAETDESNTITHCENATKIQTAIEALEQQKQQIYNDLTTETGEIKDSTYFFNTTNPDGTQNVQSYAKLRSYYGYEAVTADPWKSAEGYNALSNNLETQQSNKEIKTQNLEAKINAESSMLDNVRKEMEKVSPPNAFYKLYIAQKAVEEATEIPSNKKPTENTDTQETTKSTETYGPFIPTENPTTTATKEQLIQQQEKMDIALYNGDKEAYIAAGGYVPTEEEVLEAINTASGKLKEKDSEAVFKACDTIQIAYDWYVMSGQKEYADALLPYINI